MTNISNRDIIDIRCNERIIDAINEALNSGHTCEVKPEKTGIAVVQIRRDFKGKFTTEKKEVEG